MALPLAYFGLAGLGALALKSSHDKSQIVDNIVSPKNFALDGAIASKGAIVLKSDKLDFGSFQLGGVAAPVIPSIGLDAGAVLGTVGSVIGTGATLLTIIGGGSLAAGASAASAGIASAGPYVAIVGVIVGTIVMASIIGFQEIESLSKGRKWFVAHLDEIAAASAKGVRPAILNLSEEQTTEVANMFGYCVARGYNRASIQFVLQGLVAQARANVFGATYVTQRDIEYQTGHGADRALCLPESPYIVSPFLAVKDIPQEIRDTDPSLEYRLFGKSFSAMVARNSNVWNARFEAEADFIGRSVRCTYMAIKGMVTPSTGGLTISTSVQEDVARYVGAGCIGIHEEAILFWPNGPDYPSPVYGAYSSIQDTSKNLVKDVYGKTGLSWYYVESLNLKTAVIR